MHLSKYIKIYSYKEDPEYLLFYSTKRTSKILLHGSVLEDIERGNLSPDDEETLAGLGILVPDTKDEQEEYLKFIREGDEKRDFNAIAVLNVDCNLACTYCFEGKLKGKQFMSFETADLLIQYVKKYFSRGKNANIDFYGGEPLLSFDMIKYISGKLKAASEENGVHYTFALITNGTLLTKGRVHELVSYGLTGAKVTLDGLKDNHDQYRPFKTGAGSFDTIIHNIREVCEMIAIQIGGNYTKENFIDFPFLLDFLLEKGITQEKVDMIKFDPVTKATEQNALPDFRDGLESINEPWIMAASTYLRDEILKRRFDTQRIVPSRCAIEFKDDIIVYHDGTLYKCPALIGMKQFQAGNLKAGLQDYTESYNLNLWKTDKCLNCEYLPLCFGGCRFMKYLRDGNVGDVDCRKPYLDATLETFVEQDIKYELKTGDN